MPRSLTTVRETALLKPVTQLSLLALGFICVAFASVRAQDNYEIQVYGSETIPRGVTMIELHNNFTVRGSRQTSDGTLPTNHAWHETIEITHGFNDWFETGFYILLAPATAVAWILSARIFGRVFASRQSGIGLSA